jgi:hypothetical protein
MVSSAYSKYEVLYKGQAVVFPSALEVNTGYSSVWKAFILEGAAQPAIIAGSQSMYLITEENGAVSLQPLSEQNSSFASLQWLDSENGQPGPKREIYISEDTLADYVLSGGKHLLVNQSTVLHLPDLTTYSFTRSMSLTDDYYATEVVGFSPDQEEIIFVGNKNSPERYDKFIYGLLVYNYKTNAAYAVPFDQTETRLYLPEYITPRWIDTYFEWDSVSGDRAVLKIRKPAQLPYWQGFYNWEFAYELNPVKADLQPILLDFIKAVFALKEEDIQVDSYGDYQPYRIQIADQQFSLGYMEDLKSLSFSRTFQTKDSEENRNIIRKLGDAFNQELAKGQYQELFTRY